MTDQTGALKLAKGSYQRNLVLGRETLGGSTLRGKAKQYSGRYQVSARNLLTALKRADICFAVTLGPRGGLFSARLDFPDYQIGIEREFELELIS